MTARTKLVGANDNHLFGSPDDVSNANVAEINQKASKVGEEWSDWAASMDATIGDSGADTFVFDNVLNVKFEMSTEFQFGDVIDQSGVDLSAPVSDELLLELILDGPVFTPAGIPKFSHVRDDRRSDGGEPNSQKFTSDKSEADFHITITNRGNNNASDFNDI